MKKALLIAGFALVLGACNNDSSQKETSSTTDIASHGNHQGEEGTAVTSSTDTAGLTGKSMMSIMQSNMDQMKVVTSSGNPDNDYAGLMKVHHMGALEMAQLQVARGTDPELKQMAQAMINYQQKEIATLNTFLSGHNAHGGGDAFYKEVMEQMNTIKMDMDHSGSIDKQFAQMMIPHHQGAIDMSKAYIKAGAHEEQLKTMANTIIAAQQKEIQQLQSWLSKNGSK